MSSLPLHIVLMCAVAYSQIFGGFSCCCLSRSITAGVSSLDEVCLSNQQELVTENRPPAPKCPRCAVSQTTVAQGTQSNEVQACLARDSKCQCEIASSIATVQVEPRSLSNLVQFVATPIAIADLRPFDERKLVRTHKIPLRFGGHSWQSIACIWKN